MSVGYLTGTLAYRAIKNKENRELQEAIMKRGIEYQKWCVNQLKKENKEDSLANLDYLLNKLCESTGAEKSDGDDLYGSGKHISFPNGYNVEIKVTQNSVDKMEVKHFWKPNDIGIIDEYVEDIISNQYSASAVAGVCAMVSEVYSLESEKGKNQFSLETKIKVYIIAAIVLIVSAIGGTFFGWF